MSRHHRAQQAAQLAVAAQLGQQDVELARQLETAGCDC